MVCERPPSLARVSPSRVSPANPVGRPHDNKEEGESKTKDLRSFFLERGRVRHSPPPREGESPEGGRGSLAHHLELQLSNRSFGRAAEMPQKSRVSQQRPTCGEVRRTCVAHPQGC